MVIFAKSKFFFTIASIHFYIGGEPEINFLMSLRKNFPPAIPHTSSPPPSLLHALNIFFHPCARSEKSPSQRNIGGGSKCPIKTTSRSVGYVRSAKTAQQADSDRDLPGSLFFCSELSLFFQGPSLSCRIDNAPQVVLYGSETQM